MKWINIFPIFSKKKINGTLYKLINWFKLTQLRNVKIHLQIYVNQIPHVKSFYPMMFLLQNTYGLRRGEIKGK